MPIFPREEQLRFPEPFTSGLASSKDKEIRHHTLKLYEIHKKLCAEIDSHSFNRKSRKHEGENQTDMAMARLIKDESSRTEEKGNQTEGEEGEAYKATPTCPKAGSIAEYVFLICESPDSSLASRVVSISVLLVILLSCVSFIVESMPEYNYPQYGSSVDDSPPTFMHIDMACVIIFTIEYSARIITVPFMHPVDLIKLDYAIQVDRITESLWIQRLRMLCIWFFSPLNLIDFISVFPYWIYQYVGNSSSAHFVVLRVLRLTRVLRVFKIRRFSRSIYIVPMVASKSRYAIFLMAFFLTMMAVVVGSLMFFLEKGTYNSQTQWYERPNIYGDGNERSPFISIPHAMWWFVVTTTTLGYGDMAPTTVPGKILATLAMYMGIMTIAMPLAIISRNFDEISKRIEIEDQIKKIVEKDKAGDLELERYVRALITEIMEIDKHIMETKEIEESSAGFKPGERRSESADLLPSNTKKMKKKASRGTKSMYSFPAMLSSHHVSTPPNMGKASEDSEDRKPGFLRQQLEEFSLGIQSRVEQRELLMAFQRPLLANLKQTVEALNAGTNDIK